MRKPKGVANHTCAPADWRQTPNISGSYELDAMIIKTPNKDMVDRLENHIADNGVYAKRTAYFPGKLN